MRPMALVGLKVQAIRTLDGLESEERSVHSTGPYEVYTRN